MPYDGQLLANGSIAFSGVSNSLDYPMTPGSMPISTAGPGFGIVTIVDASLSTILRSGPVGFSEPWTLGVSDQGDVYIAGRTFDPNFPQTPYAVDDNYPLTNDGVFVSRLTPDLSSFVYSFKFGYNANFAKDLFVDDLGCAVVTGDVSHPWMPTTPGAFDTTLNNNNPIHSDGFLMRVAPDGRNLWYSTFVGGVFSDRLTAVAELASGAAVVVGGAASPNYPFTINPPPPRQGINQSVVTVLNMLPKGVDRFGIATEGCRGAPAIGVNRAPEVADPSFALTCIRAPKNGLGFLLLGSASLPAGAPASGVTLYINPASAAIAPIQANAQGGVFVPLVMHQFAPSQTMFAQFVFVDACAPAGYSASNALSILVRD